MDRAKTSGRVDDNIGFIWYLELSSESRSSESLRKRFKVFEEQTQPVIEHYRRISKLKEVDATTPADNVADQVSGFILGDETMLKKNSTWFELYTQYNSTLPRNTGTWHTLYCTFRSKNTLYTRQRQTTLL